MKKNWKTHKQLSSYFDRFIILIFAKWIEKQTFETTKLRLNEQKSMNENSKKKKKKFEI